MQQHSLGLEKTFPQMLKLVIINCKLTSCPLLFIEIIISYNSNIKKKQH